MGLALDEPKENDETHQVDGVRLIVDPFAAKIIRDAGGIAIRNSFAGPAAELHGAVACGHV
jgi:hypothetical protein